MRIVANEWRHLMEISSVFSKCLLSFNGDSFEIIVYGWDVIQSCDFLALHIGREGTHRISRQLSLVFWGSLGYCRCGHIQHTCFYMFTHLIFKHRFSGFEKIRVCSADGSLEWGDSVLLGRAQPGPAFWRMSSL